jgi:hypothetical protein
MSGQLGIALENLDIIVYVPQKSKNCARKTWTKSGYYPISQQNDCNQNFSNSRRKKRWSCQNSRSWPFTQHLLLAEGISHRKLFCIDIPFQINCVFRIGSDIFKIMIFSDQLSDPGFCEQNFHRTWEISLIWINVTLFFSEADCLGQFIQLSQFGIHGEIKMFLYETFL